MKVRKGLLILTLLLGIASPYTVKATTVTTPVSSYSMDYTVYVREKNSTSVLGHMTTSKMVGDNNTVYFKNSILAKKTCVKATAFVRGKTNVAYAEQTSTPFKCGKTVTAVQFIVFSTSAEARRAKTYGYCTVTY